MIKLKNEIDISETKLRQAGRILDILLMDRTTGKRIIWATDSYIDYDKNKKFAPQASITPSLITGKNGKIIQPRATKTLVEQKRRTKDRAEVFTPLKIVQKINKKVDRAVNKNNWQEYIQELKLEITCGEAPFIVSRYDPMANTGKLIENLQNRVGFLDKKLQIVSKFCQSKKDWLFWAKKAFEASYGFDWQGDNVLLARENLLYTFIDYYQDKFNQKPNVATKEEIAKIISWNIFQMDGLKYVVPMSCHSENKNKQNPLPFFDIEEELKICEGCRLNAPKKHNGVYVKVMDWQKGKPKRFVDLMVEKGK